MALFFLATTTNLSTVDLVATSARKAVFRTYVRKARTVVARAPIVGLASLKVGALACPSAAIGTAFAANCTSSHG